MSETRHQVMVCLSGAVRIGLFAREGLNYLQTEQDKSFYYLAAEPLFAQGKIDLLDHPQLERELKLLERRPRPGGKTIVDHPRAGHDDHANSLVVAMHAAQGGGTIDDVAFAGDRTMDLSDLDAAGDYFQYRDHGRSRFDW